MPQMPGAHTTSPSLIGRLGDWEDHDSWDTFMRRYESPVREYCRRFQLDPSTSEELVQQVWVEVARRLKSHTYDPARSFRGWLILVCRSKAIDLIRKRKLDSRFLAKLLDTPVPEPTSDDLHPEADESSLVTLAAEIQQAVRERVDERTWTAFWRVVVEGQSVRETADALGLSYAAAFAAQKRVRRMLRQEGERRQRQMPGGRDGAISSRTGILA